MVSRIPYRVLTGFIVAVALLSVLSLSVSIFAFSRQAAIAEDKANQAIHAAERSSADTADSVCTFILTFIVKPGEPEPATARGRVNSTAARKAYVALGCANFTGPVPGQP